MVHIKNTYSCGVGKDWAGWSYVSWVMGMSTVCYMEVGYGAERDLGGVFQIMLHGRLRVGQDTARWFCAHNIDVYILV